MEEISVALSINGCFKVVPSRMGSIVSFHLVGRTSIWKFCAFPLMGAINVVLWWFVVYRVLMTVQGNPTSGAS